MINKSHLLWVFAYPFYQIDRTLRHKASHALAGYIEGASIDQFKFLPSLRNGHLYWGHVIFNGSHTWMSIAAPYLRDLITFLLFFVLCMLVRFAHRWIRPNLIVLGVISALLNSLYNYLGGLAHNNDAGYLLHTLPQVEVHSYSIITMGAYIAALIILLKYSSTIRLQQDRQPRPLEVKQ